MGTKFRGQVARLPAALTALTKSPEATDFVVRALTMLETTGWIRTHCFSTGCAGTCSAGPGFRLRMVDLARFDRRPAIARPRHTTLALRAVRIRHRLSPIRSKYRRWMPQNEKIALFRDSLIAPPLIEAFPCGEMRRRAPDLAAHEHEIPHSNRAQVAVETLLIWARRYRLDGFSAPAPKSR